ncbi:hypothetical protein [uncultured Dokdonia sp.]|uniref:hypothetical protein n=1 Tax=uncultured Dokdonia sp. TaxID=575653 RepID=UPI002601DB29|nr:hypothetical protein [uncultured Dokdonia sp.]
MNKINFYKLKYSIDLKIVGNIYNTELNYQIEEFIDNKNNDKERFDLYRGGDSDHINSNIDMTVFKAHNNAIMTDLMSSSFFRQNGYFISNRFAELLKEFNIEESKLLDCTITNKQKKYSYKFLSIIATSKNINIENSTFRVIEDTAYNPVIKENNIKFNSLGDLADKTRETYFETNGEFKLEPIRVILNRSTDLFQSELDYTTLISERLKNKIEYEGLTGFDFERAKLKTEFYEDF